MTTIEADQEVLAGRVPFRTTTGLTAAPVEVRAYVKRRARSRRRRRRRAVHAAVPELRRGPASDVRLLRGDRPWPGRRPAAAPLDLAANVDGAVWLAVLARKPIEVADARELLGGKVLTHRRRARRDARRGRAPPAGSTTATSTEAFEFHLPDTLGRRCQRRPAGRVPTYRPIETRTSANVLVEPGVIELLLPDVRPAHRLWTDLDPLESGRRRLPTDARGRRARAPDHLDPGAPGRRARRRTQPVAAPPG